jgi:hypothetical protein
MGGGSDNILSTRTCRAAIISGSAMLIWTLLLIILPTEHPVSNDHNAYLGGTAALKAGDGYRFEEYIDLPRIGMYPPGYSIWLSLFWKGGAPIPSTGTV